MDRFSRAESIWEALRSRVGVGEATMAVAASTRLEMAVVNFIVKGVIGIKRRVFQGVKFDEKGKDQRNDLPKRNHARLYRSSTPVPTELEFHLLARFSGQPGISLAFVLVLSRWLLKFESICLRRWSRLVDYCSTRMYISPSSPGSPWFGPIVASPSPSQCIG